MQTLTLGLSAGLKTSQLHNAKLVQCKLILKVLSCLFPTIILYYQPVH